MKPKLRLNIETKVQNLKEKILKILNYTLYTTAKIFSHELTPYVTIKKQFFISVTF